jgi:hypothetical protein
MNPDDTMFRVKVAVCPGLIVDGAEELGAGASEKSIPLPERAAVCGLPGALSVMVAAPVRVPVAVGVNVTLIVQFALAASDAPQVLV